jgi:hypothetical protein
MRGKLEVLFGGLLLASAMVLAGCVAQTTDDDEAVDEVDSALVVEDVTSGSGERGTVTFRGTDTETSGELTGSFKGNEYTTDPQPNPWVPQSPAPPPSDPGPNKNQHQAR